MIVLVGVLGSIFSVTVFVVRSEYKDWGYRLARACIWFATARQPEAERSLNREEWLSEVHYVWQETEQATGLIFGVLLAIRYGVPSWTSHLCKRILGQGSEGTVWLVRRTFAVMRPVVYSVYDTIHSVVRAIHASLAARLVRIFAGLAGLTAILSAVMMYAYAATSIGTASDLAYLGAWIQASISIILVFKRVIASLDDHFKRMHSSENLRRYRSPGRFW